MKTRMLEELAKAYKW